MAEAAKKDPSGTMDRLREAMTGRPAPEQIAAYARQLTALGFTAGKAYALVNFRASGHDPHAKNPPHPELDTGTEGFIQLCTVVKSLGLIPVPTGDVPPSTYLYLRKQGIVDREHLIDYFTWPCCQPLPPGHSPLSPRQAEYGLLRYLADHYQVKAVGMRSGVLDAINMVGIETLSIDLAAEVLPPERADVAEHQQAGLAGQATEPSTSGLRQMRRSHRRNAKRAIILPGLFHQVYFFHPRRDNLQARDPLWAGKFDDADLARIAKTMQTFFQGPATAHLEPHSPFLLALSKSAEELKPLMVHGDIEDATSLQKLATDLHADVQTAQEQLPLVQQQQQVSRLGRRLADLDARLHVLAADLDRLEREVAALEKRVTRLLKQDESH